MHVERRLDELGLTLPAPTALPPEVEITFAWVRVRCNRAYASGHGTLAADGSPAGPFGKVPSEVTLQEAQHSARLATLAVLASLKAALSDLDRVSARLMVTGSLARTAIGVATVPLNLPVVIAAEVEIAVPKPRSTLSRAIAWACPVHAYATLRPTRASLAKPQRTGRSRRATFPMLHTQRLSRSPQTVPTNTEAADQNCWSAACAYARRRHNCEDVPLKDGRRYPTVLVAIRSPCS
jgi:hypothetical protein